MLQVCTQTTDVRFPLELELQVFVSYPMWVLGTKLKPSAKANL